MTKFPGFRVTISGETLRQVKNQMREFLGLDAEPGPQQPEEQEDFLTQAAAQPPNQSLPVTHVTHTDLPVPTLLEEKFESEPVFPSAPHFPGVDTTDSKGMPWDPRIHSANKAVKTDGSWRYRRGVEDDQIKKVEDELVTKMRNVQAAQMEPAPVIPAIPVISPRLENPFAQPVPVAQPAVPVVQPSMPKPEPLQISSVHTAETFKKNLVPVLAKLLAEGKLNQGYISQLKQFFEVDEIYKINDAQAEELFKMFVGYGFLAKAE